MQTSTSLGCCSVWSMLHRQTGGQATISPESEEFCSAEPPPPPPAKAFAEAGCCGCDAHAPALRGQGSTFAPRPPRARTVARAPSGKGGCPFPPFQSTAAEHPQSRGRQHRPGHTGLVGDPPPEAGGGGMESIHGAPALSRRPPPDPLPANTSTWGRGGLECPAGARGEDEGSRNAPLGPPCLPLPPLGLLRSDCGTRAAKPETNKRERVTWGVRCITWGWGHGYERPRPIPRRPCPRRTPHATKQALIERAERESAGPSERMRTPPHAVRGIDLWHTPPPPPRSLPHADRGHGGPDAKAVRQASARTRRRRLPPDACDGVARARAVRPGPRHDAQSETQGAP